MYSTSKTIILTALAIPLAVLLLLVGCRKSAPATPAAAPAATPSAAMIAEGKAIYAKSCASCHGPNGEGTAAAPKVAGHSPSGLKNQVRNPVGQMPPFTLALLSDADMDKLAAFIQSLGPAKATGEWEKATTETVHYWMALQAIKENDPKDAEHHLDMVLTYVPQAKHRAEVQKAMEILRRDPHDAEHEIEELAGSDSPSGISMAHFHLTLAMRRAEEKNAPLTKHHLEHFIRLVSAEDKATAQETLKLVNKGDWHEVSHEVEEMMGRRHIK